MGIGRGIVSSALVVVSVLLFAAASAWSLSKLTPPAPAALLLTDASVTCVSGGRESFRQTGVARVTFSGPWIILTDPTQPTREVRVRGACSVAGTVEP